MFPFCWCTAPTAAVWLEPSTRTKRVLFLCCRGRSVANMLQPFSAPALCFWYEPHQEPPDTVRCHDRRGVCAALPVESAFLVFQRFYFRGTVQHPTDDRATVIELQQRPQCWPVSVHIRGRGKGFRTKAGECRLPSFSLLEGSLPVRRASNRSGTCRKHGANGSPACASKPVHLQTS